MGERTIDVVKRLIVIAVLVLVVSGCRDEHESRVPDPEPRAETSGTPSSPPVLAGVEPALQERIRASYAALIVSRDSKTATNVDRARAYGQVGKLLLAAELYDQAEAYLLNAKALEPSEFAWPYYLGHAYRLRYRSDAAISSFEEVLRIKSDHVPALVWLGTMRVDAGQTDLAEPLLARAISLEPRSAAALFGLGRVALANGDAARAVTHLEAALAADPGADAVHYALAQAYRTLGQSERAQAHLRLWKDERLYPSDPLMEEVTETLKTAVIYEVRGTHAMDDRKWAEAAMLFREGLKVAPRDATLHQNLGSALFLTGDLPGAEMEFTEASRLQPGYAKALFSLGIVMQERGRDPEAIERFSQAVSADPSMVTARFSLADALRRSGKLEASLTAYAQVIKTDPGLSQARFGQAMALVRLRRFDQARGVLEDATRIHPDQPGLAHALARVLAAAPDDRVRDGSRALTIIAALERPQVQNIALMETRAMALAETGRFKDASATQRAAIGAATQAGRRDLAERMTENLRRYEAGMPCRTPWPDDDPVHFPRSSGGT